MFDWIHTLPLWSAKVGAAILYAVLLGFVWSVPKEFIYNGAPDKKLWRDLRIWACIFVAAQGITYYFF